MEIKLTDTVDCRETESQCEDSLSSATGEHDSKSNTTTPEFDMSGLTMEQQKVVRKMLKEEAASFAKGDDDIGCIQGLEMNIDLSDSAPVQKKVSQSQGHFITR